MSNPLPQAHGLRSVLSLAAVRKARRHALGDVKATAEEAFPVATGGGKADCESDTALYRDGSSCDGFLEWYSVSHFNISCVPRTW